MSGNQWSQPEDGGKAKTPADMVADFHRAFGHPIASEPGIPEDKELCLLRERLLEEEFREVMSACWKGDLVNLAKELADLLYVIHGLCLVYGIPIDDIIEEVHRSNMTKLGDDGEPIRRADGKILKGPQYDPPDIERILFRK